MGSDKHDLRRIIEPAFDDVPRPDLSLRQLALTDQKGMSGEITDEEWRLAGLLRTDLRWQDLSSFEMEHYGCQLAHTQAEEFRYYLPAYMLHALEQAHTSILESAIPGAVIFMLTPCVDHPAHSIQQYSLLDGAQKRAVAAFLSYMAHHGNEYDRKDARAAMEFWSSDA